MQIESTERRAGAPQEPSFVDVVKEVGVSVKDLVQSEVELVKAEIKDSSLNIGKYLVQAAVFGALAVLSVLPFMAFLVIALGDLMGGQYWLSSLIIAILTAAIAGSMLARVYGILKAQGFALPVARHRIARDKKMVAEKAEEVKEAADTSTKRRAA